MYGLGTGNKNFPTLYAHQDLTMGCW